MKTMKIILSVLVFTCSFVALASTDKGECYSHIEKVQLKNCVKFKAVNVLSAKCTDYDQSGICTHSQSIKETKMICMEKQIQDIWEVRYDHMRAGWYTSQAEAMKRIGHLSGENRCAFDPRIRED